MLSKEEVISHYQDMYRYFVRKSDSYLNLGLRGKFAVLMSNDRFGRIVAVSRFYKSLTSIQREAMTMGILVEPSLLNPVEFSLNDCWRWKLVQVSPTEYEWKESYEFNSIEEFDSVLLDIQKVAAFDFILGRTKRNSRNISRYIPMQEKIYLYKYQQAMEILKDESITIDFDKKYPLVSGYADIAGLDLRMAAKKIAIQHEARNSNLAEFENARIKYMKRIKEETDIKNLNNIIRAFTSEREY